MIDKGEKVLVQLRGDHDAPIIEGVYYMRAGKFSYVYDSNKLEAYDTELYTILPERTFYVQKIMDMLGGLELPELRFLHKLVKSMRESDAK
ncbi:hypothetical protein D1872_181430 [compost metagenome]